jgi:hypothetical protein
MQSHDPYRAAVEIREQLASEKRKLGFLLGAGTSMAVGLPGIKELTDLVSHRLDDESKTQYERVRAELRQGDANVENVLDRVRTYIDLMDNSEDQEFGGLKGASVARALDSAICRAICEAVRGNPPNGLGPYVAFAQWIRALHTTRDWPVEIFTTNYDLLAEHALENAGVPFFDGFVGSAAPFFAPESVDAELGRQGDAVYPPKGWTRVWKLHGSVNWRVRRDGLRATITRVSGALPGPGDEVIIFPSRDKYTQSRRLPFLAFHDRFRRFLSSGECLLVINGYSFSDQHINEIVFQGLRSNPRASAMALVYGIWSDTETGGRRALPSEIAAYGAESRNLSVYGPDRACIGGISADWGAPSRTPAAGDSWPFWEGAPQQFTLGDFNGFAKFLELFVGPGSIVGRPPIATAAAAVESPLEEESAT